jgi:predicted ATP-grasp superfamily ATP-dependent carboligase
MVLGKTRKEIVLIGFAESLAAIEVAFTLLNAGFTVYAFTRKGNKPPLKNCKLIKIIEITDPEKSIESAEKELIDILNSYDIHLYMPLDDHSLFLCNMIRDKVTPKFVGASPSLVQFSLDKRMQIKAAKEAGLNIPDTVIIERKEDLLNICYYPIYIKPALAIRSYNGRLQKGKYHIGINKNNLKKFIDSWQEKEPLLVQKFIKGTGEGLFGYYNNNNGVAWSAHKRLRMMNPHGSGSSACCSIPVDEELRKTVDNLLKKITWKGIFMIEMLKDPTGTAWFMELNGRPWGSMALAIRKGLLYPLWAVEGTLCQDFIPNVKPNNDDVVARHIGREIIHFLQVMKGSKYRNYIIWPGRLRTFINLLKINRKTYFYNYQKNEIRVFISDIIKTVAGQVFKARH